MGQTHGAFVTQNFAVSPTGSFSVSDSLGNSFTITFPVAVSGTSAVTLIGNSSAAILETRVTSSTAQLADVKLIFSVYDQFCQPAGVRLVIAGTENWGTASTGTLTLQFQNAPTKLQTSRALFGGQSSGNQSATSLGFDWSDSLAYHPAFESIHNALTYIVGSSFAIDPVTIATTTGFAAFSYQNGNVFYRNGLWWVFWADSSNYPLQIDYVYSSNEVTWSTVQTFSVGNVINNNCLAFATDASNHFWYFYSSCTSYYKTIYYRYGTLGSNGGISWSIAESSFATNCNYPGTWSGISAAIDSSGNVWLAFDSTTSSRGCSSPKIGLEVWEYTSGPWNNRGYWSWSPPSPIPSINALANGGISLVIGPIGGPSGSPTVAIQDYYWIPSLSAWSSSVGAASWLQYGSVTTIGDVSYIAAPNNGAVVFQACTWDSTCSTSQSLGSSVGTSSVSSDGVSQLTVVYVSSSGSSIYELTSTNAGSSWGQPRAVTTVETVAQPCFIVDPSLVNDLVTAAWVSGSSSPYNIRYFSYPTVIPTASPSSKSWAKPGLSPYESYFSQSSDYVSPGNGLVSYEAGTLDLPGRGLDFVPSLVYSEPYAFRSSGSPYLYDNYTGANVGYGWSLNLPWLGTNYLHLTDGEAFPYVWNGNLFQVNGVTNFVLTKNTGGTYTLNMSSGTLYRFDTSERLISITDRTGNNKISFSYGSNNYISQVTDTIGGVITFSYNSNNQLITISEGGRTWTLGYTGNQLTSLADPISTDPVTTFQYTGTSGANAWLLSTVLWPTQGEVAYTYSSAAVGTEVSTYYVTSRNVYYGSGLLSESQSISSKLINGQMVWSYSTIEDGSGTIRSYLNYTFQQSLKSVMKVYAYDGTKTLQRITETDSDTSGRTNETKIISPTGTTLAYSTYSYDNWGNMIYSEDNVGQQTWYAYANALPSSFGTSGCSTSFYTQTISSNIHDLIIGECDYQNGSGSPQQQTYFEYDSVGDLLQEKVSHSGGWLYVYYTHDSYGNVLSQENANGYTTDYRYSSTYSSAYLTKQSILVGTQNVTTTYTYNSNTGDLLSETDPNGQTTSYQYDALDRVTMITYPAISGVSSTTSYYYYGNNNTMKIIDGDGHVTKEFFDGLERETETERMNGTTVYSTQTFTYNWLNEVATNTTAAGDTYTYSYNWNGQLTKVLNPDTTYVTTTYNYVSNTKTVTDENGHQTVYAYDWNQRLISVEEYNSSTNYFLTSYAYDLGGNLLSVTDAKSQQTTYQYDDLNRLVTTTFPTSPSTTETRTYDSMGNLLTLTTANNSQISYTYDQLNRLTKVTYPGSGGTVVYTYDPDSNRLSMVNPSATDYYTYDAMDRLTNQTEYVGGAKYQTLYSYDKASNIVQITYPDGYVLSMTYDGVNRLKIVGSFAKVAYTVDDEISTITYGNGEVQTYTYNSRDWPTQIVDKYEGAKEMDLNYTYDGTGNVLSINTPSEKYTYDDLNRLVSAVGPWGTTTYAYDQTGNMIREVQGSTTTVYCYGSYNRLSSYTTSTCSSPTVSYTYDADGDLIAKTGGWTYSYNYANDLTRVTQSGTVIQRNSYDGDGNRVQQTASSSTFTYSYEGLNMLYEKNVTGSTTTITKHFYADGLQVAKMVGSGVYYLHEDALGSVRLETTTTVTVKFSSNYVPYGSNYAMTGKEVFMYTGKPYDSATGLYCEGARYYDPTIGRFITEDSISGTAGDPMSLNRYMYARDNPETIVDLAGHEWWNPISDLSAAASAVTTGVTDVAGAVSNAWSSLPPIDQAIIVVGAAVVVTVATVGVAAPIAGAAVAGEAGADAATGIAVETGADTAGEILSTSLGTVAANAGEGALVNGGVTLAKDVATGQSLSTASTWENVGISAGLGAIGGGATGGLQAAGLTGTLSSRIASNVLGGITQSSVEVAIRRPSPGNLIAGYGLDVAQGTGAGYLSYVKAPMIGGATFDFLQQFISSFN